VTALDEQGTKDFRDHCRNWLSPENSFGFDQVMSGMADKFFGK